MPSLCHKHKYKEHKGTLTVEIRHFKAKSKDDILSCTYEDNTCSFCFAENVNAHSAKSNSSKVCCDYFDPPNIHNVTIQRPSNHEELQKLLALVIPREYGPGLLERPDGTIIAPNSCNFEDGEKIIFREIRPSADNDFDVKYMHQNYDKFDFD